MKILVTGSAGFVGAHTCAILAQNDHEVIGVDSFNDYYDPRLKRARACFLAKDTIHYDLDIASPEAISKFVEEHNPDVVIHLAAQAGVRNSFLRPMDYVSSNLTGQVALLEALKSCRSLKRLIYASSSSVYSGVDTLPFTEDLVLGTPKSLYAATKIADEVLVDTYTSLYGLDAIGLRFFTVYGPWGRPDMAYWGFSEAILSKKKIQLFNHGDVRRDFTYIDDITEVILRMVNELNESEAQRSTHRVYNIGNHSPVPVDRMISILETELGEKANIDLVDLPPGDMIETYADVQKLQDDYAFAPDTSLELGLKEFAKWFLQWKLGRFRL